MTRYIAPVLAAWLVACSSDKPPESAYDASTDATTTGTAAQPSDPALVPASGIDTTREPSDPTTSSTNTSSTNTSSTHTSAPSTSTSSSGTSSERSTTATAPAAADRSNAPSSGDRAPNNTNVNERDRDPSAVTPIDQGNNSADLAITQRIRQALMGDGSLSFTAKNVKVITQNGKVTLRGPVRSPEERASVEAAARKVAGAANVDSQLEVAK